MATVSEPERTRDPFRKFSHGRRIRGLDTVTASSTDQGRFGRMFRNLGAAEAREEDLVELGRSMISREFEKKVAEGKPVDNALGEADEEENIIPAGYTYLGQFIDHDITFDPASSLDRQNDPDALHDFRTPRLDLDSIYGRGPADQPYLYEEDGLHFVLGADVGGGNDLPRNSATPARALIGDPRNDENRIVSQVHTLFLRFHNRVVDLIVDAGFEGDVFAAAQRAVRWHYQWIALHDFLPRIIGEDMHRAIFEADDPRPRLRFYRPKSGAAYMPVEFSVAAYRFGHSMVRPSYFLNNVAAVDPNPQGDFRFNRIPIFSLEPGERANLNGFGPLAQAWAIDWPFFFDGAGEQEPQPSYKIDTTLVDPLAMLPDVVAAIRRQGRGALAPGAAPRDEQFIRAMLPVRNLLRGWRLGLPSGQDVARVMGEDVIPDDRLYDMEVEDGDEIGEERRAIRVALQERFAGACPLWFYLLREAELAAESRHLGPVGGRIVGEVLAGLVAYDRQSYLRCFPRWTPAEPLDGLGLPGLPSLGIATMGELARFAGS